VDVVKQVMVFGKLTMPEITQACGAEHNSLREYLSCDQGVRADIWAGTTEIGDVAVALVRGSFIEPTSPDLQILLSDQVQRRMTVSHLAYPPKALLSPGRQSEERSGNRARSYSARPKSPTPRLSRIGRSRTNGKTCERMIASSRRPRIGERARRGRMWKNMTTILDPIFIFESITTDMVCSSGMSLSSKLPRIDGM